MTRAKTHPPTSLPYIHPLDKNNTHPPSSCNHLDWLTLDCSDRRIFLATPPATTCSPEFTRSCPQCAAAPWARWASGARCTGWARWGGTGALDQVLRFGCKQEHPYLLVRQVKNEGGWIRYLILSFPTSRISQFTCRQSFQWPSSLGFRVAQRSGEAFHSVPGEAMFTRSGEWDIERLFTGSIVPMFDLYKDQQISIPLGSTYLLRRYLGPCEKVRLDP